MQHANKDFAASDAGNEPLYFYCYQFTVDRRTDKGERRENGESDSKSIQSHHTTA